jgi:hypothetical protein
MQIIKHRSSAIAVVFVILVWSLISCSTKRDSQNCVVPNFALGAKNMGITAQKLRTAFGKPGQGPPDFSKIAKKLGLSEREFLKAMHIPEGASLCPPGSSPRDSFKKITVTVRSIDFEVNYAIFKNFAELPSDITVQRQSAVSFTRPEGGTHYYEAVHVPTNNISWVQAAVLADSVGGYLASITSVEENAFVFSLVNDEKYFWEFPDDYTPDSHYRIKIGPFLGGTKTDGSGNSRAGWVWLSGEKWSYTNWAINLDDGVIDKDPRDNTQPNGRGRQNVMGFGELNTPVATWGDYFPGVAQYENMTRPMGYNRGFIIEYDHNPNL